MLRIHHRRQAGRWPWCFLLEGGIPQPAPLCYQDIILHIFGPFDLLDLLLTSLTAICNITVACWSGCSSWCGCSGCSCCGCCSGCGCCCGGCSGCGGRCCVLAMLFILARPVATTHQLGVVAVFHRGVKQEVVLTLNNKSKSLPQFSCRRLTFIWIAQPPTQRM